MQLNMSCSWLYPAANSSSGGWIRVVVVSSSGGWIQVTADSILRLTRVPAAGYELRLTPSHGWLEFRWLDTSCGWLHLTADLSSGRWIRVTADSILPLTRVRAAGYDLRVIPSILQLTPVFRCCEFRWLDKSCRWFYPEADSSVIL